MHITLVMVASINGKITKGNDPIVSHWSSPEDQEHFSRFTHASNLLIMGRKTYEIAKSMMHHTPDRLRVVMTSKPEEFQKDAISQQLEFTSKGPKELVQELEASGYTQALLVGGASTNALFFQEHLVNDIYLTVEPKIFGTGNPLIIDMPVDLDLHLKSIKQLNSQGTLLLHYSIK
jgi:dihydrofolate reductase